MNRRNFLTVSSTGLIAMRATLAAAKTQTTTTPLFVRGLAMVKFNDPEYLRIALPEAPHHSATWAYSPAEGDLVDDMVTHPLKGNVTVSGVAPRGGNPGIRLPEVIQVRELYPNSVGNFENSPTVISIPWTAVRGVSADVLSEDRWTFVWKETQEEVVSFRPRRVAESIRIDIVSEATLAVEGSKAIPLGSVSQVRTEFVPAHEDMGDFTEHFAHYMPYIETAASANPVQPRKVGGSSSRPVNVPGASAAFARLWPFYACFVIEVD
jgi:hypothetical protein